MQLWCVEASNQDKYISFFYIEKLKHQSAHTHTHTHTHKMVNGLDRMGENWRNLGTRSTRGHNKKLKKVQCMRDIKKYSFPHRVVDTWNGLEEDVVNAISVHSFKDKLDKARYRDGS